MGLLGPWGGGLWTHWGPSGPRVLSGMVGLSGPIQTCPEPVWACLDQARSCPSLPRACLGRHRQACLKPVGAWPGLAGSEPRRPLLGPDWERSPRPDFQKMLGIVSQIPRGPCVSCPEIQGGPGWPWGLTLIMTRECNQQKKSRTQIF